jgi:hypothetical protein
MELIEAKSRVASGATTTTVRRPIEVSESVTTADGAAYAGWQR